MPDDRGADQRPDAEEDSHYEDFDDEDELDDPEEPPGLREAVADHLGGAADDAFIEICEVPVPGLTVFGAHLGRRSTAGVWDGERLDLDPDSAVQRVTDAWGYGPDRPVAASAVATVVGLIEGKPGSPFVDRDAIELGGDPHTMSPPEEIDVDGGAGVRFWNKSSRLSPYVATYLVIDGTARVERA